MMFFVAEAVSVYVSWRKLSPCVFRGGNCLRVCFVAEVVSGVAECHVSLRDRSQGFLRLQFALISVSLFLPACQQFEFNSVASVHATAIVCITIDS